MASKIASLPLKKLKVIELAGLAPVPFCGMLLADFGANVIRIDSLDTKGIPTLDKMCRNKRSLCLDLKNPHGQNLLSNLVSKSDILLDPYRPGVLEKFINFETLPPHVIVARISGFGHYTENNPMRLLGGHDINYLAVTGVLDRFTSIPMNTVADFAGGGLLAAYSILVAHTGNLQNGLPKQAQILDVNLTDGANYVANTFPLQASDMFGNPAGKNYLDGGCPFYQIYRTSDRRKMAVGCLEPKFYQTMLQTLTENSSVNFVEKYGGQNQMNFKLWPELFGQLTEIFRSETRDFWAEKFTGVDACVTPVLNSVEASKFRPNSFQTQPRLMPKPVPSSLAELIDVEMLPGDHTEEILIDFGYSADEIDSMKSSKLVA